MIKPTIGRVLWFTPSANDPDLMSDQKLPAIVSYVWNDNLVNLAVFSANGIATGRTSVSLCQDNEPKPEFGYYCEWMPYQKAVASGEISPTLHA